MSQPFTPGFTGMRYGYVSSNNKRAIGKFTDRNHLSTLNKLAPADYDKKIIQIYTQSRTYSNDFINMINQADPYYINRGDKSWKWEVEVPFEHSKIVEVPSSTSDQSKIGIDGQEFELILDTNEFSINETVCLGNKIHGPQLAVVSDPIPQGKAYLQKFTYLTDRPQTDFVDRKWLQVGVEVIAGTSVLGEFSEKMPGLGRFADRIEMFESMSSGWGRSHTITQEADEYQIDGQSVSLPRDSFGNAADLVVYAPERSSSTGKLKASGVRWEPFVEAQLRKRMVSDKTWRFLHQKAGTTRDEGNRYELKRLSDGVIPRMRKYGNYVPYNRGEFSSTLLRGVFGDLFYGRVSMGQRRVKLYTNEEGFNVFQQVAKQDALDSGLTFTTNVDAIHTKGINITDPSQHLVYGWAFDSMFTRETGLIELVHLRELEDVDLNLEYGRGKKTAPIFLCFDVSPDGDGTFKGNVREVRKSTSPSMTYGYVDGTAHHLGHAASIGMSSANTFPGYQIWFKDKSDVFIEDLSRTVLIEEIPQF